MKIRKSNTKVKAIQIGGGCCGPKSKVNTVAKETVKTSCCGTENKAETEEVKLKTGGCC